MVTQVLSGGITYVMRTMDRSPRRNYLGETLKALHASCGDAFIEQLMLVDSGPSQLADTPWWSAAIDGLPHPYVSVSVPKLTNNQNALHALREGLRPGTEWIVHLEDDIDVCKDLDGSIRRWLAKYASPEFRLYTFHTPYREVRQRMAAGFEYWHYPIKGFYGNQCWAIRREDAESLAEFLERRIPQWRSGQGFDLLIKEWAKERYPDIGYFLASCPSFVQHIGEESSLHFGRFHQNGSWPGRGWAYR